MKSKLQLFSVAVAMFSFIGCSKDINETDGGQTDQSINQPTGAPVETVAANTNYQPAFAGQTRVNSVSYSSILLTSSLSAPWGIVALPDGRFLVTEILIAIFPNNNQ